MKEGTFAGKCYTEYIHCLNELLSSFQTHERLKQEAAPDVLLIIHTSANFQYLMFVNTRSSLESLLR